MTTPAERAAERIAGACLDIICEGGLEDIVGLDKVEAAKIIREEYASVIDNLIEAAQGTDEWNEHNAGCLTQIGCTSFDADHECDCAHDELHTAVTACEEAKG